MNITLRIAAKLFIKHGFVGLFYVWKLSQQERHLCHLVYLKDLEHEAHKRQLSDLDDAINALAMTQIKTRHAAARYWAEINTATVATPSKGQP